MGFWDWLFPSGDCAQVRKDLEETKSSLATVQENYRIVYSTLQNTERERDALKVENASFDNRLVACQTFTHELEGDIQNLKTELEHANHPMVSADILDKANPKILKVKTDKSEIIYSTGFGIFKDGKKYFYEFEMPVVPVHMGGVAWKYVLNTDYFWDGMGAIEVFNQALRIVQEKYGYKTDESLYGPYDSWAPPICTQLFAYGDCEDLTQFVVNIFLTYEQVYGAFKDYFCAIGVGYLGSLCHAFPVLIKVDSDKMYEHWIGESTLNSYAPAKTFNQVKDTYKLSLGVIGHPIRGNMTGGFVVRPEYAFWKATASGTTDAPGVDAAEPPRVSGNKEKKQEILKAVWGKA